MSSDAASPPPPRLEARELRTRWPGLVWAVPLAAVLIVVYLALNALTDRGIDVVVSFSKSAGARAGDTPVVYKGVRVGRVVKIRVSPDVKRVDMTLRMEPETRNALREGARFWLIGASPNLTDLSSLQAVVSGVSIGASPGTGAPRRRFVGLDQPPPVPPDVVGTPYLLEGAAIGSTRVGAGVYYHGLDVGKITHLDLTPAGRFQLNIFVSAPYDRFVRPDTQFLRAKPLQIEFTGAGVDGQLGPGSSVLTGGVEFDTPDAAAATPQSPAGTTFPFYADEGQAENAPTGRGVRYQAVFRNAGGGLRADAPIYLADFPIGRVLQRRLVVGPQGEAVDSAATVEIEPESLGLSAAGSPADRRRRMDRLLQGLIRRGFRLQLSQKPPLLGPSVLAFRQTPNARPAARSPDGALAALPTADAPSVDSLLARLDTVPIEQIGQDVRRLTQRLSSLAGSPEIDDSLKHLDRTLAELDQITSAVKPKVGPLVAKLSAAADQLEALAKSANHTVGGAGGPQDATLPDAIRQLTEAARSIRALADDLDRRPESLLKGRRP